MTILLILAIAFGLYMAWSVGANDVANAMGTSVGSRAITFRQAVILAGIAEFCGAVLVGSHVSETVKGRIVDPAHFAANPTHLMCGMIAALLAAALWIHLASFFGQPVSTTHSIVGAVCGFGIAAGAGVKFGMLAAIVSSWVISPLAGALVGFLMFRFLTRRILAVEHPARSARRIAPFLVFLVIAILVLSFIYKGLKNLHLDLGLLPALLTAAAVAAALSVCAAFLLHLYGRRVEGHGLEAELVHVERIFRYLQIMTACYVAFAHGANDVANAVGPLAGVVQIFRLRSAAAKVPVPIWVLLMGGAGIVLGLAMFGRRVIETIGRKITELTPSRGFSAEFGAATTVLVCSKLGIPVSTTHTLVGAVLGVALARGIGSMNTRVVGQIFTCWVVTLPIAGLLGAILYLVLSGIF